MKFLHLSDLHIASHPSNNLDVETKLAKINSKFPDHQILITGDIIDNEGDVSPGTRVPIEINYGLLGELARGNTDLLNPGKHMTYTERAFRNAREMLDKFLGRLFLCPGNHDHALWGNFFDGAYALAYEKLSWELNQHISGDPRIPPNKFFPKGRPAYHRLTDGNVDIDILALNSCRTTTGLQGVFDLATGEIGQEQLINLENMLQHLERDRDRDRQRCTIVMLHHHPWFDPTILIPHPYSPIPQPISTHKLKDAKALLEIFKKYSIDYLVFGHSHTELEHKTSVPGIFYGALNAPAFRAAKNAYQFELLGTGPTEVAWRPSIPRVRAVRIAPLLTFNYRGGRFVERDDDVWEEWKNGVKTFEFRETARTQNDVILYDKSRRISVALPHDCEVGMARYRYDGHETWTALFEVERTREDVGTGRDDVVPGIFGRWPGRSNK